MKLKTYDKDNTGNKVNTPLLTIHRSGKISFNEALTKATQLYEGDPIIFMQDEEQLEDWYFVRRETSASFFLRKSKESGSLIIQKAGLAKRILDCRKPAKPLKSASYRIKPEALKHDGMELWLIFTKPIKAKEL